MAVYRPPPSPANGLKTSDFLLEFELFLHELSIAPCQVVLLGDFNIHVDTPEKEDADRFSQFWKPLVFVNTYRDPPTNLAIHLIN